MKKLLTGTAVVFSVFSAVAIGIAGTVLFYSRKVMPKVYDRGFARGWDWCDLVDAMNDYFLYE